MKGLSILLLAIIVWLQCIFWLGKNNLQDYFALDKEITAQENQNELLRQRNARMFAEIDDLSHRYDAIEERARSNLGMVKSGEVFYRIIPEQKATSE